MIKVHHIIWDWFTRWGLPFESPTTRGVIAISICVVMILILIDGLRGKKSILF